MFRLEYKVLPKQGTQYADDVGGTLIIYLSTAQNSRDADRAARAHPEGDGWTITQSEDVSQITRETCSQELQRVFQMAEETGGAYYTIAWDK